MIKQFLIPICSVSLLVVGCATSPHGMEEGLDTRPTSAPQDAATKSEVALEHPQLANGAQPAKSDPLWQQLHFGTARGEGPSQGVTESDSSEIGIVFNAMGDVNGLIDFDACLDGAAIRACSSGEVPGVYQLMSSEGVKPTTLDFESLRQKGSVLVVYNIPASIAKLMREDWAQLHEAAATWTSLVKSLAHVSFTSKYRDFGPFDYANARLVRVLAKWSHNAQIPNQWQWRPRLTLLKDPNWDIKVHLSDAKKAWIKSVQKSPIWIWDGLIMRASRHEDGPSDVSAYTMADHLNAIAKFDDLHYKSPQGPAGEIRTVENQIHAIQNRLIGAPNCWMRFRVTFRRLTALATERHELAPDQENVLNGKAPVQEVTKAMAQLPAESSAARLLELDRDLYRSEESRPLAYEFDNSWSSWLEGFRSRGGAAPDGVTKTPIRDCTVKFEK